MSTPEEGRIHVQKQLASILGFENDHDSTAEVLDHLLSMTDPSELHEYLSSLLGDSNDQVQRLADNVLRLGRGEPVVLEDESGKQDESGGGGNMKKVASAVELNYQGTAKSATKKKSPPRARPGTKKSPLRNRPQQASFAAAAAMGKEKQPAKTKKNQNNNTRKKHPPSVASAAQKQPTKSQPAPSSTASPIIFSHQPESTTTTTTTTAPSKPKTKPKPRPPLKGKPKYICGCWGTEHPYLANCLHCGRIACQKEGYGYCGHCHYLLEEVDASNKSDAATRHKERLLQYDRDTSGRHTTRIVDDHASVSHYDDSTSAWLTEGEREDAAMQEEARREEMKEVGRGRKLNIAF